MDFLFFVSVWEASFGAWFSPGSAVCAGVDFVVFDASIGAATAWEIGDAFKGLGFAEVDADLVGERVVDIGVPVCVPVRVGVSVDGVGGLVFVALVNAVDVGDFPVVFEDGEGLLGNRAGDGAGLTAEGFHSTAIGEGEWCGVAWGA